MSTSQRSGDLELIGKAARLHYEFGLTHQEIGDILRLSRVKVTRLLQQAREAGIVHIEVKTDASPYAGLEAELSQSFELAEALVVPKFDNEDRLRTAIARAGAAYLQRVLRDGMIVALGLSRTIALLPNFVVNPRPTAASFVSLVGGLRHASHVMNPYESTERLAKLFGGTAEHLHAPVVVGTREIGKVLLRDPAIARTLGRAATADVAFVGLGGMRDHMNLVAEGDLTNQEWDELLQAGAIGDIAARYFDCAGHPVEHELNQRIVGLTLPQLREIPLRVIAAGGSDKDRAIQAALRASLISVLVTDAGTAQRVIRLEQASEENDGPARRGARQESAARRAGQR